MYNMCIFDQKIHISCRKYLQLVPTQKMATDVPCQNQPTACQNVQFLTIKCTICAFSGPNMHISCKKCSQNALPKKWQQLLKSLDFERNVYELRLKIQGCCGICRRRKCLSKFCCDFSFAPPCLRLAACGVWPLLRGMLGRPWAGARVKRPRAARARARTGQAGGGLHRRPAGGGRAGSGRAGGGWALAAAGGARRACPGVGGAMWWSVAVCRQGKAPPPQHRQDPSQALILPIARMCPQLAARTPAAPRRCGTSLAASRKVRARYARTTSTPAPRPQA